MEIFYTQKAAEELKKLSQSVQGRIVKKMRFYGRQKDPLKFAKRLVNNREGSYRFRIGNYRLTFDIIKNTIFILKIGKRDKFYD